MSGFRHGMVHETSSDVHAPEGKKLCINFTLTDGPGSLGGALDVFAKHGVNMSHIESKPSSV
jgi:prephenate dehydratase